jgi:hypothetical protein
MYMRKGGLVPQSIPLPVRCPVLFTATHVSEKNRRFSDRRSFRVKCYVRRRRAMPESVLWSSLVARERCEDYNMRVLSAEVLV